MISTRIGHHLEQNKGQDSRRKLNVRDLYGRERFDPVLLGASGALLLERSLTVLKFSSLMEVSAWTHAVTKERDLGERSPSSCAVWTTQPIGFRIFRTPSNITPSYPWRNRLTDNCTTAHKIQVTCHDRGLFSNRCALVCVTRSCVCLRLPLSFCICPFGVFPRFCNCVDPTHEC